MKTIDIEKLEELPFRENRAAHITREYGNMWEIFDYRRGSSKWDYYKLAQRLCEANIGKSFDLTFSYFCKKTPKWKQDIFLKEFSIDQFRNLWYSQSFIPKLQYYGYWVDDNRLIQYNEYKYDNKPYTFFSSDYKTVTVYKSDDKLEIWCRSAERRHRKFLGDETYTKVISGYSQEYPWNSAIAKQKTAERQKANKKQEREGQKEKYTSNKADFILKYEKRIAKEKEREESRIRMEALGFDSTSFKGIEYHGQKRKLKNK